MARYRFALRPKWIFGHLLASTLIVLFVIAGFWQLSRLHQRKVFNALVRRNQREPAVDVTQLGLRPDQGTGHAKHDQGRRVRVTGTFLPDLSVLIQGQSINGQPGVWIVTPLRSAAGPLVLVNRGFLISNGGLQAPPADTAPPAGRVTVFGSVQPTETPSVFETRDPPGHHRSYRRIDVDRIRAGLGVPTLPLWVLATGQRPADPGRPLTPVPPPALTEGPHLSYAMQWFGFTIIGLVGYPILLRKKARDIEQADEAGGSPIEGEARATAGDSAGPLDEKLSATS